MWKFQFRSNLNNIRISLLLFWRLSDSFDAEKRFPFAASSIHWHSIPHIETTFTSHREEVAANSSNMLGQIVCIMHIISYCPIYITLAMEFHAKCIKSCWMNSGHTAKKSNYFEHFVSTFDWCYSYYGQSGHSCVILVNIVPKLALTCTYCKWNYPIFSPKKNEATEDMLILCIAPWINAQSHSLYSQ